MTRKEIFEKIERMLEIEKEILLKRYESGNLDYENYKELCHKRVQEYGEWKEELMLANDDEINDKLKFIIEMDLEKF
jgi:hypothetical protein